MKEKVMQGKPYAGNPHVRFDEGAGASRHSGRSALLYKDGKLYLYTVDEALRTRPDYEMRKKDVGEWRRNNLIAQFKAAGLELTPDVWERLAADRRQALEDDLAWIHP